MVIGYPSAAGLVQAIGKVRRSETDVLPLSYTTNQSIGTIDEIFGMICVLI